jgi:hypothetical protein
MKQQLLDLIRRASPTMAKSLAREVLQARILLAMQEAGAMIPLAFHGGTALRFLFDLPRFSEDLDFALERPDRGGFEMETVERRVAAHLEREGYQVETKVRKGSAVESVMVGVPGLLHEAGISRRPAEKLSIRIEVDTKPPMGAGLETTIMRRHALVNLQHHDRSSLLSGKLHAIVHRPWAKGRDLFDLFWYLSDPRWPGPNLDLLNNALQQTGWTGPVIEASSWRGIVRERIESLDWGAAERDVAPFLEPGSARALFGRESLLRLL